MMNNPTLTTLATSNVISYEFDSYKNEIKVELENDLNLKCFQFELSYEELQEVCDFDVYKSLNGEGLIRDFFLYDEIYEAIKHIICPASLDFFFWSLRNIYFDNFSSAWKLVDQWSRQLEVNDLVNL